MSAVPAPANSPDAGAVWHFGDPLGEHAPPSTRPSSSTAPTARSSPSRSRPAQLVAFDLLAARQRAGRRRGDREPQPRRPRPCRGSLGADRAGRRHLSRHRAMARRAAAGLPQQNGVLVRRRTRSGRSGGVVPARAASCRRRGAGRARCAAVARGRDRCCSAHGRLRPPSAADGGIELDLVVPRSEKAGWLERLGTAGVHQAGVWAYEAHRVAAQRPAWASTRTNARSRTRWAGSVAPCTSTRAATAGRKPSLASTTWANRPHPGCRAPGRVRRPARNR